MAASGQKRKTRFCAARRMISRLIVPPAYSSLFTALGSFFIPPRLGRRYFFTPGNLNGGFFSCLKKPLRSNPIVKNSSVMNKRPIEYGILSF